MRRIALWCAAALVAAGCSTSAKDLPLPGSGVGGDTYRINAEFVDALNLAEGAPVKVDGVTVGRVADVRAVDFTARVRLDVRTSTRLHEGATARLRSTTPLGELFVQIKDPDTSAPRLTDGARLGPRSTSAAPTIEDTMTSASLVINGGGLGQLETIVREANLALDGREGTARDVMNRIVRTAEALNASDDDIEAALDALADVSTVLDHRRDTIDAALRDIAPAARVLRENTDELATLLRSVDTLGDVTTDVIDKTRDDLLTTLREMSPAFDELNGLEDELGPGIDKLVRFAGLMDTAVPTSYLNTFLHFHGELSLGLPGTAPGAPIIRTPGLDDPGGLASPASPALPGLVGGLVGPEPRTESGPGRPPSLIGGLLGLFGGGD